MSNALIPQDLMASGTYASESNLRRVTTSNSYLPRFDIIGNNHEKLEDPDSGYARGDIVLVKSKEDWVNFGREVPILLLDVRPKAIQFKPRFLEVFDPTSKIFAELEERASRPGMSGAAFGPEYLVWVPGDIRVMASLYLRNDTGRREAPNFDALLPRFGGNGVALLKSHIFKNAKKQSWPGYQIESYDGDIEYPDWEQQAQIINRFKNPPSTTAGEEASDEDVNSQRD